MMKQLLLLLTLALSAALSAQTISTEAPSQSASATTVGKRVFQLESRLQLNETNEERLFMATHLFRVGMSDRFELRVTNGANIRKLDSMTSFNLSSIWIGAKYAFIKDPERNTKIAIISHIELPNPETRAFSEITTLAVSHSIGENHSIAYNLGHYFYLAPNEVQQNTFNFSFSYSNMLNSRFGMFAEIYGSTSRMSIGTSNYYSSGLNFDTGMIYLLRDNIQLDYSFGYGITERMYFHALGFNLMLHPDKN